MGRYDLNGAFVVLTGASSGIGRKLTEKLVRQYGCKVVGIGRSEEKLRSLAVSLGAAGKNFIPRSFDVGDRAAWSELAGFLNQSSAIPDLLINCAGILPPFSAYGKDSDAEAVLRTNFLSVVYAFEALSPLLKGSERPKIVNVGSSSALCPFAGVAAYCASKAAVWRFSECIASERGIPTAVILPGFTDTEVFRSQDFDERSKALFKKIGMNADRMADKMIKAIRRKKQRKIIGFDAHLMNFGYKFFPNLTPLIITKFLKRARPEAFAKITN